MIHPRACALQVVPESATAAADALLIALLIVSECQSTGKLRSLVEEGAEQGLCILTLSSNVHLMAALLKVWLCKADTRADTGVEGCVRAARRAGPCRGGSDREDGAAPSPTRGPITGVPGWGYSGPRFGRGSCLSGLGGRGHWAWSVCAGLYRPAPWQWQGVAQGPGTVRARGGVPYQT